MINPSETGMVNGGSKSSLGQNHSGPPRTNDPLLNRSRTENVIYSVRIATSGALTKRLQWLSPTKAITARIVVAVATALVVCVGGQLTAAKANPEWSTAGKGWSGSGSVYLPGGKNVGHSSGSTDSQCHGCTWELKPLCRDGVLDPCLTLPPFEICAAGKTRYSIMFGSGGAAPTLQGTQCIGPGERPVSSVEVDREVQDRVQQRAPTLTFSFQPSSRPVTQIPTIFRVSQPNDVSRNDSIAGLSVQLRAEVSRTWQWGDGGSRRTNDRGGRWPNSSLSHTYRTAGTKRVRVSANWTAEYSVAGARWIQVAGDPVQQSTSQTLRVREARAQLVE